MNEETRKFMLVGAIRQSLNELCAATGQDYSLYIPSKEAKEAYEELERQYTEFYKLPIQERLYKSGMASKSTEQL